MVAYASALDFYDDKNYSCYLNQEIQGIFCTFCIPVTTVNCEWVGVDDNVFVQPREES